MLEAFMKNLYLFTPHAGFFLFDETFKMQIYFCLILLLKFQHVNAVTQ